MHSVRVEKGDYVTATSVNALWRITKSTDGWDVFQYTESVHGLDEQIPIEFLDWDRWECWATYKTKREALAFLEERRTAA